MTIPVALRNVLKLKVLHDFVFLYLQIFISFSTDDYTEIIMISDRKEYGDDYGYKEEIIEKRAITDVPYSFPRPTPPKPVKKERAIHPSSTSFNVPFQFVESGRRNQLMICEGRKYIQNNKYGEKIYWKCSKWHDGCKARAITLMSQPECIIRRNEHNHPENSSDKDDDKETTME